MNKKQDMESGAAEMAGALDALGYCDLGEVLDEAETAGLIAQYDREDAFRSRIVMQRHGFGMGEYKYFRHPLPDCVARLRAQLYPPLARVANAWAERLGLAGRYPDAHEAFLQHCREAGQAQPTPLLLRYGPGDYNRLHQDVYGKVHFPIQVVVLLSAAEDFSGGEFVLAEQRPRMQTRAEVVALRQGHGLAFAVNERPVPGKRGYMRAKMRHGVSTVRSGSRYTLGIIFHDAT